jgi:hypothetical protein
LLTPKGKKKSVEKQRAFAAEDQLNMTHFKILVYGVLTYSSWPPLLIQTDI